MHTARFLIHTLRLSRLCDEFAVNTDELVGLCTNNEYVESFRRSATAANETILTRPRQKRVYGVFIRPSSDDKRYALAFPEIISVLTTTRAF